MTPEKALNLLNDMEFAEKYQGEEIYTDMLLTIKDALEKRIPQKLIHINGYKCCPVCKEEICSIGDDGCYGFFCVNKDCGQALDWEK